MEHLSTEQIAKFRQGTLQESELLAADAHLAACEICRSKLRSNTLAARSWVELGQSLRASAAASEGHLSFDLLRGYVDGSLPNADRMHVETHLLDCAACRTEVDDLKSFAAGLRSPRAPRRNRYLIFGPIAAALIIGFVLTRPSQAPPPQLSVSLRDSGRIIGLDRKGTLVGGAGSDAAAAALRDGRIAVRRPEGLRSERSVLLGGETKSSGFRITTPVGEAVLTDKPEFRWGPLPGARSYRVQVFDADYRPVASSPEISATNWTPAEPLSRGKKYAWQVTATRGGEQVSAPQPPDPEARFEIVSAEDAAAIDQARRSSAGHLDLATRYAHAGLCRETTGELDALDRENPGSTLLQQIRASVSTQCTQPY